MFHVFEGERCIFCRVNIYDTDEEVCPNRSDPESEAISYTTDSEVKSDHVTVIPLKKENGSILGYDGDEEIAEIFFNTYNNNVSIFIDTVAPFYPIRAWEEDGKLHVKTYPQVVFEEYKELI